MGRSSLTRLVLIAALAAATMVTGCAPATPVEQAPVEAPAQGGVEPPATDAAGDDAEFVQTKCTMCHSYDRVAAATYDEAGWTEVVDRMIQNGFVATEEEKARIIAFLAAQ